MSSRKFESGGSKRRRKEKQIKKLKKYRGYMDEFVINSDKCVAIKCHNFFIVN